MARWALIATMLAGAVHLSAAADVPVAGHKLILKASATKPAKRRAVLVVRDPALAAPFPDPRSATTTLVVHGGAAAGQCFVSVDLEAAGWTPLGNDGPQRGFRYKHAAPGASGVRLVLLRPGRLTVKANGAAWPCLLEAVAQRLPVTAVLSAAGTRYCAAFGGTVASNTTGRFIARGAPAPSACPASDLRVANLNILHGLFCPAPTASCRYAERIDLLFQWLEASGCPDVATLQEVKEDQVPIITGHLPGACGYASFYERSNGIDDQLVLARHAITTSSVTRLYKNFRSATHVRLDHPMGPVDVVSTHLASGSDGANLPCAGDCPAECVTAGAATVRQCQGVQLASLAASVHQATTPAVVTGDLNEPPGSFVYQQLAGRGWVDSYLAAGNPECDGGATGVGCTAGRDDDDLGQLESPASNQSERIDYVWVIPATTGACTVEPAGDPDGDQTATRIFADEPNPFVPTCGPAPDAICWPSDHEGAELDLNCQ